MRRSLSFPCEGETLFATIDESAGPVGLLIVTGGQQTRIGPHRMMAKLARDLAEAGHPVFRFDRRGVGDSSGNDPGYIGSAQDIAAAVDAFKAEQPLGKALGAWPLRWRDIACPPSRANRLRRPDPSQPLGGRGGGWEPTSRGRPRALS